MTELELESFPAKRLTEDLMAETNSKNRHAAFDQITHRVHSVAKRRRVAGAVREKNSSGLMLQRLGCRRSGGHNLHAEPVLPQPAQDVVFHPEIVGHNGNVRR